MKNKVVNINPFDLKIKDGTLTITGTRAGQGETYEIKIHFKKAWWFTVLSKECINYLRKEMNDLYKHIKEIKQF